MRPTTVLATITGRDRPGVTAAFFASLAAHDVDLRDVEQVVLRDRLHLAVLLELRGDTGALRASVTSAAAALGMDSEVGLAEELPAPTRSSCSAVTVLGCPLRAGALGAMAQRIADLGDNIESVVQLPSDRTGGVEMLVRTADPNALRTEVFGTAQEVGVDVAVEPAGQVRRSKRLVLLDLEATLVPDARLASLAERAGVGSRVGGLPARRRSGEAAAGEWVREQASLLAGLPEHQVWGLCDRLRPAPGAAASIRSLRRSGFAVGLISDGPRVVADRFVRELRLDFAVANDLEVRDGTLTGRLIGPPLDGARKAAALHSFAADRNVPMDQTVAAGRSSELELLATAGLAVAFCGRSPEDAAGNLDRVLFLLGVPADDDPAG
jgi:phosphoserine phosphatase